MRQFLPTLLAIALAGAVGHAVEVRQGAAPGGRAGLVIDSSLLKVGIVPELGGRIVELIPKKVYKNYLRIVPQHFGLGPDDQIPPGGYGGIFDCPGETWPGEFWALPYTAKPITSDDGVGVRVVGETDGLRITRDMIVPQGESRLIVRVRQTNVGETDRSTMARLHGEFRVGTTADVGDIAFWRAGGGSVLDQCSLLSAGAPTTVTIADGGWVAIVDTVEGEALVHRLRRPAEECRVLLQGCKPEPTGQSHTEPPWYSLGRIGAEKRLQPGESIETEEEFWTLKSIARIDFCTETGVGALDIPHARFGSGDDLLLTATFAAPLVTEAATVELTIAAEDGDVVLSTRRPLAAFAAGESSVVRIAWNTGAHQDGIYRATVTFTRGGLLLGAATRQFEIAGVLIDGAEAAVVELRRKLNTVTADWSEERLTDRLRMDVLNVRVAALETDLRERNFEHVVDRSPHVGAAIDRAIERHTSELPSLQADADRLGQILERYRSRPQPK